MKKATIGIVIFGAAILLAGVRTTQAYPTYEDGCMVCHGSGAGTPVHSFHGEQGCITCHVNGAGQLPVPSNTCAGCHPPDDPGLCALADGHAGTSVSCLDCHMSDCESPSECDLTVSYRKIISGKLLKPRRRLLSITGNEDFDPFGERDLGPLIVKQVFFRERKLRAVVLVPAGLEPQIIPIRVGDCSGGVEIQ